MNHCEMLQEIMDNGAWGGGPPIDLGDGYAISIGEDEVAILGMSFGGMVSMPWDIVLKLASHSPHRKEPQHESLNYVRLTRRTC